MPRGGYQRPSNPAPVSGPGALSRRTDGGPTQGAKYIPGGKYGESKALMDAQTAAPMAASRQPSMPQQSAGLSPLTLLTAPTERPNEPPTAGMSFGPGPGLEAVGIVQQNQNLSSVLAKIAPYDKTGQVTELMNYLTSRGL